MMADENAKTVDIMFLHDTHSHLNEFTTVETTESVTMGGFARIKTLINQQKAENPNTLLLDAGDFAMGTLVQAVYEEEASELRMLGELGVDATVLGNHEFDYKAKGLSNMLNAAVKSGDAVPSLLFCNMDWETMKAAGLTEDQQLIWDAFENYGVKEGISLCKGMFAIALYDRENKELFLLRDRVGEKPLYYGWVNGSFVFASDVGCIAELEGFQNGISKSGLTTGIIALVCYVLSFLANID